MTTSQVDYTMSFGGSVDDIVTVGQLAWTVYKGCKDAPEDFKNLSQEVLSLHVVLKEVEECLTSESLSLSKQSRLKTVTGGCSKVLEDLQVLVNRYRGLDTQSRRTWDRAKFASEKTTELRSRLISHTSCSQYVLLVSVVVADWDCNSARQVVEKTSNGYLRDFQTGRRDGSIISTETVRSIVSTQTTPSISLEDQETWRTIRKELEDMGISIADFDANKPFILDWFKTAVDNGSFDQQAPCETLSNKSEIIASGDSLGNLADDHRRNSTASDLDESSHGTSSNATHIKDNNNSLPVATAIENADSQLASDKEDTSQTRPMLLPVPSPQKRPRRCYCDIAFHKQERE